MKLENIDLSKLKLADVPKFRQCPCELCDDGCFEKAGNEHYPQCRRRLPQRSQLAKSAQFPLTHYQGTFLASASNNGGVSDYSRRPCPPAPNNEIPTSFKNVPMSGLSSQRDHFQPPPAGIKKQPLLGPSSSSEQIFMPRAVPMETRSHYQAEYVEKSVVPVTVHPAKESQINITEPTGSMTSQTTTRSHFKSWQVSPSHPFVEMPPAAAHVLYPGSNRQFDTTSGSNFVSYRDVTKIKPTTRLEPSGNLEIPGGSMDLRTNYRQDYLAPTKSLTKPEKKFVTEPKVYVKPPMNGISQTTFDYRAYPEHRPPQMAYIEPSQSQVSIGNMNSQILKESQYRTDYPGHDTNQHPRQPAIIPKDENRVYVLPKQKMDTVTVTQRDFQPIDISSLPKIRLVPLRSSFSLQDQAGPMENVTMTRYHYQAYEPAASQQRYGELAPNLYIAPTTKFHSTTTTGETYQGRAGPAARPAMPEMESIRPSGKHDHRTNYRLDYPAHGSSLCAAKAFTIAKKKETKTESIPA